MTRHAAAAGQGAENDTPAASCRRWRMTTRASGWAACTWRSGPRRPKSYDWDDAPSSAVTDSNHVGLTGPGALRRGR
jgi:hypothetical protein